MVVKWPIVKKKQFEFVGTDSKRDKEERRGREKQARGGNLSKRSWYLKKSKYPRWGGTDVKSSV